MRSYVGVIAIAIVVLLLATIDHPVPIGSVSSTSMAPVLERGDVFFAVPPTVFGSVSTGDIVVFRGGDGWTVHRAIEVTPDYLLTAGDANVVTDQQAGARPIHHGEVVGIVPTVAGRPVAVGMGFLSISRMEAALLGGVFLAAGLRTDRSPIRRRGPSPIALGGLTAGVVTLAWLLDPRSHGVGPAQLVNTGPLPLIAVDPSVPSATVIWPGQPFQPVSSEIRTLPGWAPSSLLDLAASVHPMVLLLVIAAVTGGTTMVVAAVVSRWTDP